MNKQLMSFNLLKNHFKWLQLGMIIPIFCTTVSTYANETNVVKSESIVFDFRKVKIKGNVKDSNGNPISFASIISAKENTAVYSDENGNFEIDVNIDDQIIIESMGFITQYITIKKEE